MLQLRRNHRKSSLLQDATRAGSRIAEETRGVAQTARVELGDLGREVREQASGGVTTVRRRTARRLEKAAAAMEQGKTKRSRRKPLLVTLLLAVAGWIAVKAARASGSQTDEGERVDEAEKAARETAAATSGKVADTAQKVAEEADKVRATQRQRASSGNTTRN